MRYSKMKLVNRTGEEECMSNIYNSDRCDCAKIEDAIEDARSLKSIADNLNRLYLYGQFTLDRSFSDRIRYRFEDVSGNVKYLYLYNVD